MIAALTDIDSQTAGASPSQKRRPRVFVVDDAVVVRSLITECVEEIPGLELAGTAGSEDTALSWLRSHPCDVLILDLELRRGTGLGLLKALASFEPSRKFVKIIYTNHTDESSRQAAGRNGASYFFDKMLETDKLRLLLQDIAASAT